MSFIKSYSAVCALIMSICIAAQSALAMGIDGPDLYKGKGGLQMSERCISIKAPNIANDNVGICRVERPVMNLSNSVLLSTMETPNMANPCMSGYGSDNSDMDENVKMIGVQRSLERLNDLMEIKRQVDELVSLRQQEIDYYRDLFRLIKEMHMQEVY